MTKDDLAPEEASIADMDELWEEEEGFSDSDRGGGRGGGGPSSSSPEESTTLGTDKSEKKDDDAKFLRYRIISLGQFSSLLAAYSPLKNESESSPLSRAPSAMARYENFS